MGVDEEIHSRHPVAADAAGDRHHSDHLPTIISNSLREFYSEAELLPYHRSASHHSQTTHAHHRTTTTPPLPPLSPSSTPSPPPPTNKEYDAAGILDHSTHGVHFAASTPELTSGASMSMDSGPAPSTSPDAVLHGFLLGDRSASAEKERLDSRARIWEETPRWKKWLVQFNVSHFGLALGTSAHTVLWRTLNEWYAFIAIPQSIWFTLWFIALSIFVVEIITYFVRAVVFPRGVARDLGNNRFINFFLTPVIAGSALLITIPPDIRESIGERVLMGLVMAIMAYQLVFALYIYGDWLFARNFTLDAVDPTYQMAVIGFFLIAGIAASLDQKQVAEFNLYVGLLFWIVVFVSLFQNVGVSLRNANMTPSPTMFLFLAPPAAAFLASKNLDLCRARALNVDPQMADLTTFFIMADVFIYMLLIRMLPVWAFQRFTAAWWAYIFPLSSSATAILSYASAVDTPFWEVVATIASVIAICAMLLVAALTVYHVFKGNLPKDDGAVELYCRVVQSAAATREFTRANMLGRRSHGSLRP